MAFVRSRPLIDETALHSQNPRMISLTPSAPTLRPPSHRAATVFTADLAGLRAQAQGLVDAAGLDPDFRVLRPRAPWSLLSPKLWPGARRVLNPTLLAPPFGDVLIGCGGASARLLAQLRSPDRPAVIIQHPRLDPARFDLIIAAPHDRISGANVFIARTALHRVTPALLAAAAAQWSARFAPLPRPLVSVLIGGSNGRYRLDEPTARRLAADLAAMMRRDHVGLVLTPSRRTSPLVRAIFTETLAPLGADIWDMQGENPYFGMLALADAIIVTADSVSMVSEAVATTAPVLLARLPGRSTRIGAFMDDMVTRGRARWFAGRLESGSTDALNDTPAAAEALRQCLGWISDARD